MGDGDGGKHPWMSFAQASASAGHDLVADIRRLNLHNSVPLFQCDHLCHLVTAVSGCLAGFSLF